MSESIRIDNNECIFDPASDGLARYQATGPKELREKLSQVYGIESRKILTTRGAEEALLLAIQAFAPRTSPENEVIISPPDFDYFQFLLARLGAKAVSVPRQFVRNGKDAKFPIDGSAILNAISGRTKIVYLVNPNNPTPDFATTDEISPISSKLGDRGILLIDEAYLEFTHQSSMATLIEKFPNIVVARTLSKAWGAAALRVGALIGRPEHLEKARAFMQAHPFSRPTLDAAIETLAHPEIVQRRTLDLERRKKRFVEELQALEICEWVSHGAPPFALASFRFENPGEFLAQEGVLTRHGFKDARLSRAVRFGIGTDDEIDRVLKTLRTRNK